MQYFFLPKSHPFDIEKKGKRKKYFTQSMKEKNSNVKSRFCSCSSINCILSVRLTIYALIKIESDCQQFAHLSTSNSEIFHCLDLVR